MIDWVALGIGFMIGWLVTGALLRARRRRDEFRAARARATIKYWDGTS